METTRAEHPQRLGIASLEGEGGTAEPAEDGDSSRSGLCFQLQQSPGGLAALPACCSAAQDLAQVKGAELVLWHGGAAGSSVPGEWWWGSGVVGDASCTTLTACNSDSSDRNGLHEFGVFFCHFVPSQKAS